MSMTSVRTAEPWTAGFTSITDETADEVDLDVEGRMPQEISGTLYRVGPAGFEVGGDRYRHWFDGDGMVHALRVDAGRVRYRSRWVATAGRQAEVAAGRRLFAGGFATPPPGGLRQRLGNSRPKNVANINVVAHAGRLRALWEAGRPHLIDPDTLETLGEDDLGGLLGPTDGFSAHPRPDPATGELWNFGITYGRNVSLSIYRGAADGRWTRVVRLPLPHAYMVHDMALTPTSVVLVLAPVALPTIPIALLTGRKGFAGSLRYRPRWGTTIMVIDRETGSVRTHRTEPFMVFHVAGVREGDGTLEIDICSYPDMSVVSILGGVMEGRGASDLRPTLECLQIDRSGGVTRRRLTELPLELPRQLGQGRVLGLTLGENAEFLNTPAIVDTANGTSVQAPVPSWEFVGEVVPVGRRWGLAIALDGRAETSELRVLDLDDLTATPVATARLPRMVPFGLHGNFVATGSS